MNLRYNKSPYDTARTTNQGFVCCHLRIWRNPAYSLGRHDNELTDTTRSPSHYAWCQITLALTHNFATLEKANGKPYCYYPFPLHSSDYKYPLLYPIFTPRYRRHCRNEKCARWNTETVISHHEHWHTSQCRNERLTLRRICWTKVFTRRSPSHLLSVNYAVQMNMSEHRLCVVVNWMS